MKSFYLLSLLLTATLVKAQFFERIATFHVCRNIDDNCNTDVETVAEIVTVSQDGNTLIYTDGVTGNIGFVNITDPSNPLPAGLYSMEQSGSPTSVTVVREFAVAVSDTSASFINPSGILSVIDIASFSPVRTIELGGQPDSVTVSPDGNTIAIAIENQRDEAFGDGNPPQLPAGFLVLINSTSSDPLDWTLQTVTLTGLSGADFPSDPEPEYVSINSDNICAVTLQENNALVLVDVVSATVINNFTTGSANVSLIDATEDGVIVQNETLFSRLRQPDGVTWLGTRYIATADEGDLDSGGTRSFSIFDSTDGSVVYTSGSDLEWAAVNVGQYPEDRSENRGIEPEGIVYTEIDGIQYLILVAERANLVFIYDASDPTNPLVSQVLSTSTPSPEGIVAIPNRSLFAVACEVDDRGAKIRSSISIFEYSLNVTSRIPTYALVSLGRGTGFDPPFIPFSALSGLAAFPPFGDTSVNTTTALYTVEDSSFQKNRILTIDYSDSFFGVKVILGELFMADTLDILQSKLSSVSYVDLPSVINSDKTVNIDPEGIAIAADRAHFWIVSEGRGTVGDLSRPVELPNMLLLVEMTTGAITQVELLPDAVNAKQSRFGFEGVAVYGTYVVVAFQGAWIGESRPRLGLFDTVAKTWKFVFYTLDAVESQNGGSVGLSEITSSGDGRFLVLERDDQGGPDAAIKRLYEINLGPNLNAVVDGSIVTKRLYVDLMPILAETWGNIPEKVEGMTIDVFGQIYVINDNDGLVDNSGEQQLNFVGEYIPLPSVAPTRAPVRPPALAPVRPPAPAPVRSPTKAPTKPGRSSCGLFGLSLFCPLTRCGVFGSLLGLCKN